MTPEGKVKAAIKKLLRDAGAYWHCPVQNGMGEQALDFMHVTYSGQTCAIEAKAPGETPTPKQWITINRIRAAGGRVMIIDGTYEELIQWLLWTRAYAPKTTSE